MVTLGYIMVIMMFKSVPCRGGRAQGTIFRRGTKVRRLFGLNFKLGSQFKMSSRGEAGTLVAIIVSIFSFFVVATVMAKFIAGSDDATVENLCHGSIGARAATAVRIGSEDSALLSTQLKSVPALCRTIDTKVKGDREVLKKAFAQKIARCWWEFGEGKYDEILKTGDISVLPAIYGVGSSKNSCFVCYTVIVDQDKIEPGDAGDCRAHPDDCAISSQELLNYMSDTPYKTAYDKCEDDTCSTCESNDECAEETTCQNNKCVPTTTLTYLNYIQKYGGPGRVGLLTDTIKSDHAYAITFLPKNRPIGGSSLGRAVICGLNPLVCLAKELISDSLPPIFKEREYSSIYISDLVTAQKFCSEGDLAGK